MVESINLEIDYVPIKRHEKMKLHCANLYAENKAKEERIKELEALRDTVSINCNPPADCNDPKVLKTYMKACFDEAEKLYD